MVSVVPSPDYADLLDPWWQPDMDPVYLKPPSSLFWVAGDIKKCKEIRKLQLLMTVR